MTVFGSQLEATSTDDVARDPLAAVPDDSLDRSERVIAAGRFILSVSALAILFLDPREPMYSTTTLYTVLSAYIVYSAILLWLLTRDSLRSRTSSKPILLADVAWFTLIVILSEGSTSPFFLLYLFAVCTAAMRWGIRTTVRVAAFSGALYLLSVLSVRRAVLGPDFAIHTAHLMRPIYLVILAYLIGFIGEHEMAAKNRLIEMVGVQNEVGRSRSQLRTLARLLRRLAEFFAADYCQLQLRVPDRPALHWEAHRQGDDPLTFKAEPAGPWSHAAASQIAYRVRDGGPLFGRRVEAFAAGGLRAGSVFESDEPAFLSRSEMPTVLSVPIVANDGVRGRLTIARRRSNFSREDLDFCQTLIAQSAVILENVALQRKAEDLAVAEERTRIARDLHDGFMQSLASIDVGIEVCRKMSVKKPQALGGELSDLQRTVKQGYREARRYLDRLRKRYPVGPEVEEAALEMVSEFRERTDINVNLHARVPSLPARHGLGFELLQIVREALTNIQRHAGATSASVRIEGGPDGYTLLIRDDGKGFPAAGDDDGELPSTAAPWSIRERVSALGGRLSVTSRSGGGSEIEITFPATTAYKQAV